MILHFIILALGVIMFTSGSIIERKIKDKWVSMLDYVAIGLMSAGSLSLVVSAYHLLIELV